MQNDKQVIEEIRGFPGQRRLVLLDCRNDGFDGLFAELLGGARRASIEKRFCVRGGSIRACARGDDSLEITEAEAAHETFPRPANAASFAAREASRELVPVPSRRTGRPCFAINALASAMLNSPK